MTVLVVTGATGYIGCHLVRAAVARGWHVVAASRTPSTDPDVPWIPYRLEDDLAGDLFPLGAAVIHLAADTLGDSAGGEELEVAAAQRLLDTARERNLRVIYVSSQAARRDAPTAYGRAKWRVEERVLQAGGKVVRPGLVYGGRPGGLYRRLLNQVKGAVALPALLPAPRIQPIHVMDLVEGLMRVVERDDLPSSVFNLAAQEPVSFTAFLRVLAAVRLRRRRAFVPMPTALLTPVVHAANRTLGRTYDVERLRSLVDLPLLPCASTLAALDLRLRPLVSGLHPSGSDRRRRILAEGRALISYLLGERAPTALMRRYARAVEGVRDGLPAGVPGVLLAWPGCLAILDSHALLRSAGVEELDWRLDAATALSEASPAGARRFLMIGDSTGAAGAAVSLGAVVVSEAFWRLVRLFASPFLRRTLKKRHGDG
jgi:nucleoside-diphosphate-sugar epimerase